MKNKHITWLFFTLLCMNAWAYDFSAECPSGQTLYYTITSDVEPYTVAVTRQNADWPYYYSFPSGNITIPDTVTYDSITYTVTSLGEDVFYNCSGITSITLPNTIVALGDGCFAGCSQLSQISIPGTVTSINGRAFLSCSSLTSITIPETITSIGERAFGNCSGLTQITIPPSVTYIGTLAFQSCTGLTSFTLPNSVIDMGDRAFWGCTNITEPIYNSTLFAYYPAGYDSIYTIPEGIKTIVGWAFNNNTQITNIEFPQSLQNIGYRAFYGCTNLSSINLPDSVTTLGTSAFDGCGNARSITIGKMMTTLGQDAFWGCESAMTIISRSPIAPSLESPTVFDYVPVNAQVLIPCGSTASYMSRWSHFSNFEEPVMPTVTVASSNPALGTAVVLTQPSCSDSLCVILATGIGGYSFLEWQDGNQENPRTIRVDRDTIMTAYFVMNHTLQATSGNVDWGTTIGSGNYAHGDTAIMAAIVKVGYRFVGWQDGNTDNPRKVAVLSDSAFTALFALPDTMFVHDTNTLIVTDTLFLPQYVYDTITLSDIDTVVVELLDTLIVHDTVMVDIYPDFFSVNVYSDGHGTGVGNGSFPIGCTIEIAGLPHEGFRFARWSDGDLTNPRTVQVTADASYTAIFEEDGPVGVVSVPESTYEITTNGDIVTLKGALGMRVRIFDALGRCLLSEMAGNDTRYYKMPASGIYLLQVGNDNSQKIVITQ